MSAEKKTPGETPAHFGVRYSQAIQKVKDLMERAREARQEKVEARISNDETALFKASEKSADTDTLNFELLKEIPSLLNADRADIKNEKHRMAKQKAQKYAKEKWDRGDRSRTKDMAETVKELLAADNMGYPLGTVRTWIREVAPPFASKPGREKKT